MIVYVRMQSLKNKIRSHLLLHCKPCLCETMMSLTRILRRSDDTVAQELVEVHFLKRKEKQVMYK